MSPILVICFILAQALVGLSMGIEKGQTLVQSNRKLGNHDPSISESSMPPNSHEQKETASTEEMEIAPEAGELQPHHHHSHRWMDKSVAGGGVILGGLATTFLVVVFFYIRATGRDQSETGSNA
ncbi:hypothetical protein LINPERHAP1_LOCUS39598 [Linum perenne]